MGILTTILNTLKSIQAFITTIPRAISAIYSWTITGLDDLANDITKLEDYIYTQISVDLNYAYSLYILVTNWAVNELDQVYAWAGAQIQSALDWASKQFGVVIGYIDGLEQWAQDQITGLIQWVITNIWDPIWNSINSILNWINTYGAFMLNLLTHPDQLAAFLGKWILSAWVGLGKQYALPFFRWFLANAISLAPDIAGVLEDIVSSLFD
jgi:hypothetical protein